MSAKTRSISAEEAFETLIISFKEDDGKKTKYRSKPLTRSKRRQYADSNKEMEGLKDNDELAEDDKDQRAVEIAASMIALCVEPLDGAPEDVAAYIVEKWEAEELADAYIERLVLELGQAVSPFSGMSA